MLVVQTHIGVLIDDGFEVEPSKRVSQINHYSCQAIGQAEIHLKLLLSALWNQCNVTTLALFSGKLNTPVVGGPGPKHSKT